MWKGKHLFRVRSSFPLHVEKALKVSIFLMPWNCSSRQQPAHQELIHTHSQFGVQCLAQGDFHMWTKEDGDRTTGLLIGRWPTLSIEPQLLMLCVCVYPIFGTQLLTANKPKEQEDVGRKQCMPKGKQLPGEQCKFTRVKKFLFKFWCLTLNYNWKHHVSERMLCQDD